jgi:hypothetical protein
MKDFVNEFRAREIAALNLLGKMKGKKFAMKRCMTFRFGKTSPIH